ncbi:MAG: hypothetical protein ACK5EU_20040 [Pseudanabaena sp.]|jgi:hypothetical protein
MMGTPLLARGRDRLETKNTNLSAGIIKVSPLLARGRDRLETEVGVVLGQ